MWNVAYLPRQEQAPTQTLSDIVKTQDLGKRKLSTDDKFGGFVGTM